MSDGMTNCLGGKDLVLQGIFPSMVLGIVIPGSMAFILYTTLASIQCSFATNICVSIIAVPLVVVEVLLYANFVCGKKLNCQGPGLLNRFANRHCIGQAFIILYYGV